MTDKLNINQWAVEDRPREKLLAQGARALSDAELLAILIGSGTADENAVELMRRILNDCGGSLQALGRMRLDDFTAYKGVGPAKAKLFANLNIFTLRDLICHFPRGYEDRTKILPIEKMEVDVPACFKAMVMNTPRTAHIRKGLDVTKVQVADHTGRLNITFFNRS